MEDVMDLNEEEFRKILSIPITTGKVIAAEGNYFTGYTICIQTHKEIRDAYMKLKLTKAEARHIVCAYNIPGMELQYCKDYWDDEEYGAGKFLLKLLMDHKITSRAIFIVCRTNGRKIGTIRHKHFMDAAISAINVNQYNKYAKKEQKISAEQNPRERKTKSEAPQGKKR